MLNLFEYLIKSFFGEHLTVTSRPIINSIKDVSNFSNRQNYENNKTVYLT